MPVRETGHLEIIMAYNIIDHRNIFEKIKDKKVIKDLKIALKDFEPMVKDPRHLWNGRAIQNFSLRPREAWANWLICSVLQKIKDPKITFGEDDKGDGFFIDRKSGTFIFTEHVSALDTPEGKKLPKGEQRIIDAIDLKIARGPEYAKGKWLVVFFDGAGKFYRSKIRENITSRHNFSSVFCVGLLDSRPKLYSYIATEFRDSYGVQSVTFRIDINGDFTDWKISQITL